MTEHVHKSRGRVRPTVEGLEDRLALSSLGLFYSGPNADDLGTPWGRVTDRQNGIASTDRRLVYDTPEGTHVIITLYGIGSLAGSTVNPDGSLNLVYSGTNSGTRIFGFAHGGNGYAPLQSILPANPADAQNLTGVGMNPINSLRMSSFTLVSGGQINLTAGVNIVQLYAIDGDTQMNLRELPESFTAGKDGTESGGDNGIVLTYSPGPDDSQVLSSVTGTFTAGANLAYANPTTNGVPDSGAPSAPPGLALKVEHIYGPANPSLSLSNYAGAALIDVQGNVQYVKSVDATGLMLNDMGNLNLVKMQHLTDALIVGEPFGHAALPNRQDVTIISTNRTTDTRDNVFVIPDLEPIGPLSQP